MHIKELVSAAFANAKSKGFHDPGNARTTMEALMLVVTELAEAAECYRTGDMALRLSPEGKPEGFPSEIADAMIRLADMAGAMDMDLEKAIEVKMSYNATRSRMHGGKRL